ncbi:hypothetical protein EC988_000630 [Linderina pennispora]|nr:hypothetical protein EC988_000630 [Linderina pennispora]
MTTRALPIDDVLAKRIIGGTTAPTGRYPYITYIQSTYNNSNFMCGGTIVSDQYIVTAAHCFYDESTGHVPQDLQIKIGYGSNDLQNLVFKDAMQLYVHPQYSPQTSTNDIAIVQVPKLPLDGQNVDKIPVYTGELFPETQFVALGWGVTDAVRGTTSMLLKEGVVTIGKDVDCAKYLTGSGNAAFSSNGRQICSQNSLAPGTSPCFGDSGTGNIVYVNGKPHVIGLTSFGSGASGGSRCDAPDGFVIYTHISAYMDFVNSIVKLQ